MADWEPIRRTGQEVEGIDPNYPGLVVIRIELTPDPPPGWAELWSPYPPDSTFSVGHAPPVIRGNQVTLRIPEETVKSTVKALDAQIEAANQWYEKEILPRLRAGEERRRKEKEEELRRIEAARRQLEELD